MRGLLAEFIRLRLFQLDVTEAELAKRIGTEQPNVSRVKNGKSSIPFEEIESWSMALEIESKEERIHFIELCRRIRADQKPEAAMVISQFEKACEIFREREVSWRRRLNHSHLAMNRAIEVLGRMENSQARDEALDILHSGFYIHGNGSLHESVEAGSDPADDVDFMPPPAVPLANVKDAKPVGSISDLDLRVPHRLGFKFGFHDADGRPSFCLYDVGILDAEMRYVGGDVFHVAGSQKLQSRIQKLAQRLTKNGLPRGWYHIQISWSFVGAESSSVFWLINTTTNEIKDA
jgi:transcriptional regulator with XRE-family HTH domain